MHPDKKLLLTTPITWFLIGCTLVSNLYFHNKELTLLLNVVAFPLYTSPAPNTTMQHGLTDELFRCPMLVIDCRPFFNVPHWNSEPKCSYFLQRMQKFDVAAHQTSTSTTSWWTTSACRRVAAGAKCASARRTSATGPCPSPTTISTALSLSPSFSCSSVVTSD